MQLCPVFIQNISAVNALLLFRNNMAAVDVTLDIHRKALFCWFGGEISFRLKIRGGRNTPCIAGFPNCTAGTKDPTKAAKGGLFCGGQLHRW